MLTLRKLTVIGVFLAALVPSAYLAWTLRTMPHLGFYHDDSIYWVSGRSLAMGDGYRIESLPGQPYQTKYPPLYPALLAAIWKLDPQFPANLPLATLFAWLLLPLFLAALWFLLARIRIQSARAICLDPDRGLESGDGGVQLFADAGAVVHGSAIGQRDPRRARDEAGCAALAGAGRGHLRGAGVPRQIHRSAAAAHSPVVLRAAQAVPKSRAVLRGDAAGRRRDGNGGWRGT